MAVFVAVLLPLAVGISMYLSVARTWSRSGVVGLLTTQPSASEFLGEIIKPNDPGGTGLRPLALRSSVPRTYNATRSGAHTRHPM